MIPKTVTAAVEAKAWTFEAMAKAIKIWPRGQRLASRTKSPVKCEVTGLGMYCKCATDLVRRVAHAYAELSRSPQPPARACTSWHTTGQRLPCSALAGCLPGKYDDQPEPCRQTPVPEMTVDGHRQPVVACILCGIADL